MSQPFDPGYHQEPFLSLCADYPEEDVYPADSFRVEWGPIFHRGRLDGTARILVIGQDPAQHEAITRRILIGEAGQRFQGFLGKLGIERSYVMINTFLYSVYGQFGGEHHRDDAGIIAYRHRWLDAILATSPIEAVVALGGLADRAWAAWDAAADPTRPRPAYARVTHPTQPESSSKGDPEKRAAAMRALLQSWNAALQLLAPAIAHPDVRRDLVLYGEALGPDDLRPIPAFDLPAGLPPWMRALDRWAKRAGATPEEKRANVTITIPRRFLP